MASQRQGWGTAAAQINLATHPLVLSRTRGERGSFFYDPSSAHAVGEHLSITAGGVNLKITLWAGEASVGERGLFHYMTPLCFTMLGARRLHTNVFQNKTLLLPVP